jgi:hypothetical protein
MEYISPLQEKRCLMFGDIVMAQSASPLPDGAAVSEVRLGDMVRVGWHSHPGLRW